ncbi:malonyl CoA-acyl carrier protein transacylase, partial [Xylella fastidiosa subsp. multiplex]|nr:malonyl CoA-acyl carrier protein transacylase [Xylella fastidiosa subsp. multiplex]
RELATCGVVRIAECGPGKVLMGLIRRIDKTLDVRSLATPTGFSDVLDEWGF